MKAKEGPITLKALYQQVTGDLETHQRRIHALFLKQDERRQAMITERRNGTGYHVIAAAHGINAASARECILRGIEAIRKAAHQEPRFKTRKGKEVGGGL